MNSSSKVFTLLIYIFSWSNDAFSIIASICFLFRCLNTKLKSIYSFLRIVMSLVASISPKLLKLTFICPYLNPFKLVSGVIVIKLILKLEFRHIFII
jgi:hypothetical protein